MIDMTRGAGATSSDTTTAAAKKNSEVTKDAFLQLLVAQVKNQDPLNPTDGVQFLSQLAQFTELEQVIGLRSDVQSIGAALKPTDTTTQTNSQGAETANV